MKFHFSVLLMENQLIFLNQLLHDYKNHIVYSKINNNCESDGCTLVEIQSNPIPFYLIANYKNGVLSENGVFFTKEENGLFYLVKFENNSIVHLYNYVIKDFDIIDEEDGKRWEGAVCIKLDNQEVLFPCGYGVYYDEDGSVDFRGIRFGNELNGYGGSGRNGNFYGLPDLKEQLLKYNAYFCSGHDNAFGAFLLPSQIQTIVESFDRDFNSATFEDTVYEVDYWFHTGEEIDKEMLLEIASYSDLWGNSIPQPKFAFDINYNSSQIKIMGANQDSLKITYNGIDFVAFKCGDIIAQLQEKESGHISIVGRAQLNEWNGRRTIQIMIDDIEINAENTISLQDLI